MSPLPLATPPLVLAPPPVGRPAADVVARASASLALALGLPRPAARAAGRRAARLWRRHRLAGSDCDLLATLGQGHPSSLQTPVRVRGMGIHLVCPHHLTVALGHAEVAYLPAGRLVGLGRLARLARRACARLVLQEQATQEMADVLVRALGAQASWVQITAAHPCVGISAPRSHPAQAISQAGAGDAAAQARLQAWLRPPRGD